MSVDQRSIPKDLRHLNLSRAAGDATPMAEGFFANSAFPPGYYPDATLGRGVKVGTMAAYSSSQPAWSSPLPVSEPSVAAAEPSRRDEVAAEDMRPKKVKFLCSFGGKILPRPINGVLRYVGGQTRIISFRRDVSFQELVHKMVEACGQPVVIKYQLPGEDLDALVSVSCPEDLENMMEEYEKLAENADGSAKLRVFLFCASDTDSSEVLHSEITDSGQWYVDAVNGISDIASGIQRKESMASLSSTQNSDGLMSGGEGANYSDGHVVFTEALSPAGLSSTDVETGQETGSLVDMPPNDETVTPEHVQLNLPPISIGCPRTVSSGGSEPELVRQVSDLVRPSLIPDSHASVSNYHPITAYSQNYVDNWFDFPQNSAQVGYINPQSMRATMQASHPQQLPSHQFLPMVHATVAFPSPKLAVKPVCGQQHFMQLHPQMRVEPYQEDSLAGASGVKPPTDHSYQFFQPQPLTPGQLVDQCNWHLVPPVSPPDPDAKMTQPHSQCMVSASAEKFLGLDDCFMCQKGLPHVHSDTLLQEHGKLPTSKTNSDTAAILQSHHPDENMRSRLVERVDPQNEHAACVEKTEYASSSSGIWPKFAGNVDPSIHNIMTPHLISFGSPQVPEYEHDSGRINVKKADDLVYPSTFLSPSGTVFPGDGQGSYGMLIGNPQTTQKAIFQHPDALSSQYEVKQDTLINKAAGNNIPPTSLLLQTSEPSLHGENHVCVPREDASSQYQVKLDSVVNRTVGNDIPLTNRNLQASDPPLFTGLNHMFVSKDVTNVSTFQLKPFENRMEALHVTPSEILDIAEQNIMHNKPSGISAKDLKPENILLGVESVVGASGPVTLSNIINARDEKPDIKVHNPGNDTHMNTKSMAVSEGNCAKDNDPFSPSFGGADFLDFQRGESGIGPNKVGNFIAYQKPGAGIDPSLHNEIWQSKPTFSFMDPTNNTGDWQDGASNFHGTIIYNDATAPANSNCLLSAANSNGLIAEDCSPHFPSNSLFSNQDPWKLRHEMQFPPPKFSKVASMETLLPRDSNGLSHSCSGDEVCITTSIEEGPFHLLSKDLNKDAIQQTGQSAKASAEEQIKQDLQAVAEGVAASVFQSSIPLVDISSGCERNRSSAESKRDCVPLYEASDTVAKDIKDKFLEKSRIAEGINKLQIIKNGDLEELRELGSGTFGTVYHGKWRGTDVAIKRINDRCFAGKPAEQERMRNDFWNEACKLADLHHPNVVAFYGVVLDGPGGSVATVTEFMVNGSLGNALHRSDKTLDYRKRLMIAMDVAFGMEYLHGKNIVHFDLKSDNLLVNLRDPHRPICKVGDLGLSKVKCQTLISGGVRGTLPWMAPELLNGSSSLVSEKVDVFSFGIVMWELLTGQIPYADLHYGAIIGGIVNNTLRPAVPENCDQEWRSLMEKCWSSEPSERPSFTEIAATLRSMAAAVPAKGLSQPQHPSQSQTQK